MNEAATTPDPDHWWQRRLRSKLSLRLVLLWFALVAWGDMEDRRSGVGFAIGIGMTTMAMFASEGLAVFWPRLFGHRDHLWRRIANAGRALNAESLSDCRPGPSNVPHGPESAASS